MKGRGDGYRLILALHPHQLIHRGGRFSILQGVTKPLEISFKRAALIRNFLLQKNHEVVNIHQPTNHANFEGLLSGSVLTRSYRAPTSSHIPYGAFRLLFCSHVRERALTHSMFSPPTPSPKWARAKGEVGI